MISGLALLSWGRPLSPSSVGWPTHPPRGFSGFQRPWRSTSVGQAPSAGLVASTRTPNAPAIAGACHRGRRHRFLFTLLIPSAASSSLLSDLSGFRSERTSHSLSLSLHPVPSLARRSSRRAASSVPQRAPILPSNRKRRRGPLPGDADDAGGMSFHSCTTWDAQRARQLQDPLCDAPPLFLPLSPHSHKGSSGRIGILGGNAQYTGAPYYAGMAALHVGADLAYVFTAQEAALPLKCYSPELMVLPVYSATDFDAALRKRRQQEEAPEASAVASSSNEASAADESLLLVQGMVDAVAPYLERLHCLVVGPGLGRCPLVMQAVARLLELAQQKHVAVVLDADALFLLSQPKYCRLLSSKDCRSVVTPNAVEYERLVAADVDLSSAVVVRKGPTDVVSMGNDETSLICSEEGGWKRSGGIGDVLAGTVATLIAWQVLLDPESQRHWPMACWTACCAVRRATRSAFAERRRAMTAPDILRHLGDAVRGMEGDAGDA